MRLDGVLAPVVTPFTRDRDVDVNGFTNNIRAHLDAGVCGIVAMGSTGEAALLEEGERRTLVEAAREAVPSNAALLIGCGAESTRATVARTRMAAELGADAALVVAPHYYGDQMTAESIEEHYVRVADASPLPVLLYTIPKYMHFEIPPEVVARLAEHQNIIGMKDSAGDAKLFQRYLESQSESFKVLTGSGVLWREALRMGAHGGILAVSLFAPALTFDVLNSARAGRDEAADRAQTMLTPLAARIVGKMGVPGVKAALDEVGLAGGSPRAPLRALNAEARAALKEMLSTAALATAA